MWIPELEVGLGLRSGDYQGVTRLWLRWYDAQGNCVLTKAEAERNRAIEAEYRAAQLAERLRSAGLDPDM